jgi:hypothetical protein
MVIAVAKDIPAMPVERWFAILPEAASQVWKQKKQGPAEKYQSVDVDDRVRLECSCRHRQPVGRGEAQEGHGSTG